MAVDGGTDEQSLDGTRRPLWVLRPVWREGDAYRLPDPTEADDG